MHEQSHYSPAVANVSYVTDSIMQIAYSLCAHASILPTYVACH